MIDIHNHILVDIDDGPKTIEKSIALLKQAKYEGVTSIVATPHHLHPRYDNTFQQVLVKLAELRTDPEVQALDIKLFPGQEIRITDSILQGLDNGSIQGINRSKYLLIEFPTGEVPHYTKQFFLKYNREATYQSLHILKEIEVSPKIQKYYMNLLQMGH